MKCLDELPKTTGYAIHVKHLYSLLQRETIPPNPFSTRLSVTRNGLIVQKAGQINLEEQPPKEIYQALLSFLLSILKNKNTKLSFFGEISKPGPRYEGGDWTIERNPDQMMGKINLQVFYQHKALATLLIHSSLLSPTEHDEHSIEKAVTCIVFRLIQALKYSSDSRTSPTFTINLED